jgi:hypothetical protein
MFTLKHSAKPSAKRSAKHSARAALLAVAGGTVLAASLAGAADASQTQQRGFSPVESCTALSGTVHWHPGLVKTGLKTEHAVLTGTLSGCTGLNGAQAGTGTVTAVLSGRSRLGAIAENGTLTVNWPTASGLNPSNGTVSVRRAGTDQPFTVSGSLTSGAFTGAALSTSLLATTQTGTGSSHHPVTRTSFVNTTPFAARVNLG